MSKRARQPDRDPNVAAFDMVRKLEEATSHEDDYTRGSDKGGAEGNGKGAEEEKRAGE